MTRAIWVPSKSWKRKGQAKHFTIAKNAKASRAEKAWLKLSKGKSNAR